ncbi:DUF962 domain protein [Rhodotorula diobovata]|uniref:DUF962 domain protein n=1 Tax=Rhodotorula diobovata TaxID=5288 RepID=A0A5C5G7T0_9BASI|nr:DUF962 domain protein [Rhodotorula diobovata]
MARSKLLDFEHQFSFYASYHTNTKNVLIHVLCVPTILFTALILTHGIPGAAKSLAHVDVDLLGKHFGVDVTVPFLWAAGNAAYFVALEPVAGLLYAPILLAFGHYSNVLYSAHHDEAMRYATVAHVASWIAQFVGHGAFEGRAPALLDSLLQSVVLAVFFVFLEVLFALGYRPALFKRLQARTGVAVAEFRKERAARERAKAS